ncbi:MAG: AAA family ATPase [Methanophagales archaeon]|nr:AAA family ATPase [Methanophagales archaeon]
MKIKSITIHNFRSIKEARVDPYDYTVLVGANNAGKSNALTALRIFYEDGIKFNDKSDFPKFQTEDNESWIEIEYLLTDEEFSNLKDEYKNPGNILKVRKYLKSEDKNRVNANQSNIYGYESAILSEKLFYGAKNFSQAKLGLVIYIPEVTKTDETLKLSGPSPLRDIITFVMKKVVTTSDSFVGLNKAFEEFNNKFKEEASKDGFSLSKLRKEINESLKEWEVEFNLNINPVRPEDIIKNLVSHYAIDKTLDKEIDIKYLGQGLQRHLIYTLLKLSSQYIEKRAYEKKEFSPELTLVLFEEPEAFLHPGQQEFLNTSLKSLSSEEGQQIIVSTHSPIFVSKHIEDIPASIKLKRENGITKVFQVSEDTRKTIIEQNNELAQLLQDKFNDPSVDESIKNRIRKIMGDTDDDTRMEEEAIRYLLWLDSERCSAFFADIVLICEGAAEKVFIDYLIKDKWNDLKEKRIYVLDTMGKFNIHRYMNLFRELGIYHSILADKDENNNVHKFINQFIEDQKNDYTKSIDFFDKDIETFLGINAPPSTRRDKKPLNVMWHYSKGKISQNKIGDLKNKVQGLL